MDVDFVVDRQFQQDVRTREGWAVIERQLELYSAVVLPAFEPNSTAERNGGAKWKLQHDTAVALDVLEGIISSRCRCRRLVVPLGSFCQLVVVSFFVQLARGMHQSSSTAAS